MTVLVEFIYNNSFYNLPSKKWNISKFKQGKQLTWSHVHPVLQMSVLTVLAAAVPVLAVVLFIQYRWRHRHILSAASKVPCPPAFPVIGNAFMFIGSIGSKYFLNISVLFYCYCLFCFYRNFYSLLALDRIRYKSLISQLNFRVFTQWL